MSGPPSDAASPGLPFFRDNEQGELPMNPRNPHARSARVAALSIALVVTVPTLLSLAAGDAEAATVMSAHLPTARRYTSAVWTGQYAYVFGGWSTSGNTPGYEVLRYDPANDAIRVMNASLPTARWGTSAIWDGTYAYIF